MLPEICEALAEEGIVNPFPIQALAIPIAITGNDLIGQARTGTGKTLAFGVSLLQRIHPEGSEGYDKLKHPGKPQALVMCPTRELALQVSRDLELASSIRAARILTIYGGVGYEPQLDALAAGVDVVVGTPGRLLDLVNRRDLDLSQVKVVVLDEADEMLDLGFLPDVERLLSRANGDRQTMLFSATMPAAILSLARANLNRPINIRAEGHNAQATVPDTTQHVFQAHDLDKPEIVGRVLQANDVEKVIVFTRTKRAAQRVADDLADRGFEASSIHGDLNQNMREKALKKFRAGKIRVLVATDVAARGIDVSGVSHVINYECPDSEMTYVHRIGRTGRAGAKGVAITLVDWADITRWNLINKALDLGMPDPVETYSTSPHLYEQLDIPEGTKGRVPGFVPPERPERDKPAGDKGRGRGRGGERDRGDRARGERDRTGDKPRRRRRQGETETVTVAGEPAADGAQPQRRRRRRRRSGDSSGESAPSEG